MRASRNRHYALPVVVLLMAVGLLAAGGPPPEVRVVGVRVTQPAAKTVIVPLDLTLGLGF